MDLLLNKYQLRLSLTDDIYFTDHKIFIKSTASVFLNNEFIAVNGFAEMSEHKGMSSEQCTGTASSYARKYALNGLFLIDDTKDADTMPPTSHEPKKDVKTDLKPCDMATFDKMTGAAKMATDAKGKQAVLDRAVNYYSLSPEQLALLTSLCK